MTANPPRRANGHRPDHAEVFSLRLLQGALRRQFPWFAGAVLLVVTATAVLTFRQRPVYEARATLRLEERPPGAADPVDPLSWPQSIETEIELIRSRSVAEDVVRTLALHVSVSEPRELERQEALVALRADSAVPGVWVVERDSAGFTVRSPGGASARAPWGDSVVLAGLMLVAREPRGRAEPISLTVSDPGAAAEALRSGLRVSRPQVAARIVQVSWQGTSRALTRDAVNEVARAYIERRNQIQKQQARTAVRFLREQVGSIGAQLAEAESRMEQFRRARLMVDPQTQSTHQVRRLAELSAEREQLEFRRTALREVIARAERDSSGPAGAADPGAWASLAATPALAGDQTIASLLGQLTTAQTEATRLGMWRTPEDPDLRAVRNALTAVAGRLAAYAREQFRGIDDQIRRHDSALAGQAAVLQAIPSAELEYARLDRQVVLTGQLYTLLQTRLKEAEISEAIEAANIQLVDGALLPRVPIRPRKVVNLIFGLAAGWLLGAIIMLMREMTDTTLRSRDEVADVTDLPVLAVIPRQGLVNGRRGARSLESRLVTRHAPLSPAAEAYRALRTNIAFSGLPKQRALRTLVVTSAEPQDGKSTTAVNLAATLAEQGLRVLLLEADQRRPVLHTVLGVARVPGLSDILAGRATVAEAAHRVPLASHATGTLDFVAGGTRVPNPAELVGSARMRSLLADVAGAYDAIVLDTPPLSLVTDAAVTGTAADGVIVVARMGATNRDSLRRAVEELRAVGAPVVGTVLTDAREGEDRYGHRYGQYYDAADENGNGR
jgi:polysaccharide biosynthesis transport protein